MTISNRNKDNRIEKEIEDYIEAYLWKRLKKHTYERVFDKARQIQGMDIILDNGKKIIDNKCKVKGLLNKVIDSISFEVLFRNSANNFQEGWFIKPSIKTTHYGFISVFTGETNIDNITSRNVTKVVYLLVKKEEVRNLVGKKTNDILNDAKQLAYNDETIIHYDDSALYFSKKIYPEQPVNLLVYRSILKKLPSTIELEITPSSVKIL